jgi:hypothetical protein
VTFWCWQVPLTQVSVVQGLLSSQFMQAPPFEPQFATAFTKHWLPEMQPVQQTALPVHTPPGQG